MSNSPRARLHTEAEDFNSPRPDSTASVAVSAARAPAFACPEEHASLHHLLPRQVRDAHLPSNANTPELRALLKLVSEHYDAIDEERRGIVKSMRLLADEARALAREAHEQSSEHLQVILDHIKDVVLTLDEDGRIRTFNPTAERVFGYDAAEIIGRRIDLLVPHIAQNETIPEALQRLAANSGDTLTDLAARESWGVRKDGKMFPAEIAISHAPLSRREMFVACLREVTERHEAERVAAAEHDVFEKLTPRSPRRCASRSLRRPRSPI